jgi:hypothetical protein
VNPIIFRLVNSTDNDTIISIAGANTDGAIILAFAFLSNGGPATHLIGFPHTSNASITESGAEWQASTEGGSGKITVDTITATRVTGTFQFMADSAVGDATGTDTVTNGEFAIPFSDSLGTTPAGAAALARIRTTLHH